MLKNNQAFSSFSVDDLDVAEDFYAQTLGVNVSRDQMGLQLKLADGMEVFIYPKDGHQPASFTVLNFLVDDIDAMVDELAANGVEFEFYENDDMLQDDKGIHRGRSDRLNADIAWFEDPAGNVLAIIEEK